MLSVILLSLLNGLSGIYWVSYFSNNEIVETIECNGYKYIPAHNIEIKCEQK